MLDRVTFTIKGKSYESLPLTVGRIIDFNVQRAAISRGTYNLMFQDLAGTPERVLDMIDCKAFMVIFSPKFMEDIKPNSIDDLGILDFEEVLCEYRKTVKPFLEDIKKHLSRRDDA